MNSKWAEYEGRLVGNRRLDTLLGVRGKTAFYLSKGDGQRRDRLVELVPAGDEGASTVESWKQAHDLSDDQLIRVYSMGEASLDGKRLAYAFLDLPDDDLNEMLNHGLLQHDRALTMFTEIILTLDTLHRRGLAHGSVQPSSIYVIHGETRLGVDTLQRAGKREKERDLRQFGTTLVLALTGRSDAVAQLRSPFKEVATACLTSSSRLSASRVYEMLTGRAAPPGRVRAQWPLWASAGVGLATVLLYFGLHRSAPRPQPTTPAAPVAATPQPVQTPQAQVRQTPPPERDRAASKPAPIPKHTREKPAPVQQASGPRQSTAAASGQWAVIMYTYKNFEAAQKHAAEFAKKFPKMNVHAYPPAGKGSEYYIVLGSHLSQNEADRIRREAVDQGAPRDTLIRKLPE